MVMSYAEKLKDPQWQRKRLRILERDEWTCQNCGEKWKTLHVHHLVYRDGVAPWDYSDHELVSVCDDCHNDEHATLGLCLDAAAAVMRLPWSPVRSLIVDRLTEKIERLGWPAEETGPDRPAAD